ncbi:hypothetical protein GCK72_008905 [Caenorhabditis remanei]|uniref:RNA helicase n=1 Tax=Caenorhabditis remanei TaxID=31234 RepID=A0A6A5H1I3_CAERE|nr:hypothetical protein GCK72_008905 [Caenorhabditis remanei]KAF1760656.1 hypothetical protein GCK72_008905 [Caenorhabditis remanei]
MSLSETSDAKEGVGFRGYLPECKNILHKEGEEDKSCRFCNVDPPSDDPPIVDKELIKRETWKSESRGPRDERTEWELFSKKLSGINFDEYDEIPVDSSGREFRQLFGHFSVLNLHEWIKDNIKSAGYDRLTPVQKYCIPALQSGQDTFVCAQREESHFGMISAYLIPVVDSILQDGPDDVYRSDTSSRGRKKKQYPSALVLAPTRERSLQIYNESRKFVYRTPIKSALLYGGRENYNDQIHKLRLGCHILIATPGRLKNVMDQGLIGLEGCRYLVLDASDCMLKMGFEPMIRQIVERMPPKEERVTAIFSSSSTTDMKLFTEEILKINKLDLTIGLGMNECYDSNMLMSKAWFYFNLSPPDVTQACEKAWLSAVYAIRLLFLETDSIHLESHKSLRFAVEFVARLMPSEKFLLVFDGFKTADRLHLFSHGNAYFMTELLPRTFREVEDVIETISKIDKKKLKTIFNDDFGNGENEDWRERGVSVKKKSHDVIFAGKTYRARYSVIVSGDDYSAPEHDYFS